MAKALCFQSKLDFNNLLFI